MMRDQFPYISVGKRVEVVRHNRLLNSSERMVGVLDGEPKNQNGRWVFEFVPDNDIYDGRTLVNLAEIDEINEVAEP